MNINEINFENLTTQELLDLKTKIENIISQKNGKVKITIFYNQYKGTGKAWIAKIDENGKILGFLDQIGGSKNGYKGEKIFELAEGKRYRINQEGSKSYDDRYDVIVSEGKIIKI